MKKLLVFFALAFAAAVSGLVVSSLLLIDYVRPAPVFCEETGCDAVKHTAYAHILHVPLPAFGMTAFAVLGGLLLARGKWPRLLALISAALMAVFAAFLLGVQKMMGSFCPFCVVTDVSAIVALVGTAVRYSASWDPPQNLWARASGASALAFAVAIPITVGLRREPKYPTPPGLPEPIAQEIKNTPNGKVSVVDFVDYECPFCRATNAALEPVLSRHQSQLRLVRKQVPLRMHPHARDAAKAACCAEELGHGDDFSQALFETPVAELTPDNCESLAKNRGIDASTFHECVQSTRTEEHLKTDTETFKAVHGHGLPTIWVDTEELKGEQSEEELEQAVQRALSRRKG